MDLRTLWVVTWRLAGTGARDSCQIMRIDDSVLKLSPVAASSAAWSETPSTQRSYHRRGIDCERLVRFAAEPKLY